MKNLNKHPIAFKGALNKRKEHKSPESRGNHKIKMVSICCECGLLMKSLLQVGSEFPLQNKKFTKMDDLRVQAKKRREG